MRGICTRVSINQYKGPYTAMGCGYPAMGTASLWPQHCLVSCSELQLLAQAPCAHGHGDAAQSELYCKLTGALSTALCRSYRALRAMPGIDTLLACSLSALAVDAYAMAEFEVELALTVVLKNLSTRSSTQELPTGRAPFVQPICPPCLVTAIIKFGFVLIAE